MYTEIHSSAITAASTTRYPEGTMGSRMPKASGTNAGHNGIGQYDLKCESSAVYSCRPVK
jgi:hypothetical protein